MNMNLMVYFYNFDNEINVEEILCEKISDTICSIKDIPLYAYNLAFGDIVFFQKENNDYFFEDLCLASGNSTIQIVELIENKLNDVLNEIVDFVDKIRFNHDKRYAAINIKTKRDYLNIQNILNLYEENNFISFREACLGFNL